MGNLERTDMASGCDRLARGWGWGKAVYLDIWMRLWDYCRWKEEQVRLIQRYNGDEVFPDIYSLQSSMTPRSRISQALIHAKEAAMRTDTGCAVFQL